MIEEIKSFGDRKEELIKKGKEKGFITYEELANGLKGLDIDSDSLDDLYNSLIESNIEIVNDESEVGADSEEDVSGDIEEVCEELADVFTYCIQMAMKLDVDPEEIILKKLDKTRKKYPVEKAKGVSTKYNKL